MPPCAERRLTGHEHDATHHYVISRPRRHARHALSTIEPLQHEHHVHCFATPSYLRSTPRARHATYVILSRYYSACCKASPTIYRHIIVETFDAAHFTKYRQSQPMTTCRHYGACRHDAVRSTPTPCRIICLHAKHRLNAHITTTRRACATNTPSRRRSPTARRTSHDAKHAKTRIIIHHAHVSHRFTVAIRPRIPRPHTTLINT